VDWFQYALPDKFVPGYIIAKLPPSWWNFATTLKHKRQEILVENMIASLDVENMIASLDVVPRFRNVVSVATSQKTRF
jgi:hypothetical protein